MKTLLDRRASICDTKTTTTIATTVRRPVWVLVALLTYEAFLTYSLWLGNDIGWRVARVILQLSPLVLLFCKRGAIHADWYILRLSRPFSRTRYFAREAMSNIHADPEQRGDNYTVSFDYDGEKVTLFRRLNREDADEVIVRLRNRLRI